MGPQVGPAAVQPGTGPTTGGGIIKSIGPQIAQRDTCICESASDPILHQGGELQETQGRSASTSDLIARYQLIDRRAFNDVQDNFGTNTLAAGVWAQSVGTWGWSAGQVAVSSGAGVTLDALLTYADQINYRDVAVAIDIMGGDDLVGPALAMSGGPSWSGYAAVYDSSGPSIILWRINAGAFTLLASPSIAVAPPFSLRLSLIKGQLRVTAPGVNTTVNDATYTNGRVGIAAQLGWTGGAIDSITITDRPTS